MKAVQSLQDKARDSQLSRRDLTKRSLAGAAAMSAMAITSPRSTVAKRVMAQDDDVVLNFVWRSDAQSEAMVPVIEEFEATHPGIRINLEGYPFRQLFETIEIRMQASSPEIDILAVDSPLTPSYTVRGFLHPLNDYFSEEEIANTWVDAAVGAGSWDGQFMSAPVNNSTQFLYFNRRYFDEQGVEPPPALVPGAGGSPDLIEEVTGSRWTWDQVVDAAQQLTLDTDADGRTDVWGFHFHQVNRPYQILALPESLGQPSVSEDGLTTDRYLNSEKWIQAATFYRDLFNTWEVSPKGVAAEQGNELFLSGNAAMYLATVSQLQRFLEVADLDFDIGIAAHPYFEEGRVATPTGSWNVGVSAFSEHKDEAAEFVKFLTASSNGSRIWYDAYGDFPVTQELLDFIETSEDASEFPESAFRLAVYEARNTAVPRPQTPGYLEFEDILSTTIEDIRNGADPEQALNAAVERIDRGLERYEGL